MTPTLDPDQVMHAWRNVKRMNGPEVYPQLDLLLSDGSRHIAVVPSGAPGVLMAVDTITRRSDLPLVAIAFLTDAYMRTLPPERAAEYGPGSARTAFLAGSPDATECLIVTTLDAAGELHLIQQPYVERVGLIDFGELITDPEWVDGAVVDVLREAMRRFG